MRIVTFSSLVALSIATFAPTPIFAAEPQSCQTVRFSDVGWTDITATTAIASTILDALDYNSNVRILSVPVTYAALSAGDIDVFLGYWKPSMTPDLAPYDADGSVETVRTNLTGARYTLAVPQFAYDQGLQSFDDIARFGEQLDYKIYGIEPGNDGNRIILSMLEQDGYDLNNFRIVESSEQAMLAEVGALIDENKPIVFLAWEPHPMNMRYDIAYLSGGEEYFGANYGSATVGTNVRKGYVEQCPNVGRFLQNLEFNVAMENQLMEKILAGQDSPEKIAHQYLRDNPQILEGWLEGVTTFNGENGLDAVRNALQ